MVKIDKQEIYRILSEVPDPEIPVLSIIELGMIRDVRIQAEQIIIDLTPTYTGCPATDMIKSDIATAMLNNGYTNCHINVVIDPPWNTDWIGEEAKEKLRKYGIAPPEKSSYDKYNLMLEPDQIHCPRCNSIDTTMISQFGSTACKAMCKCNSCLEPFDYFKCHR